MTEIVSYKVSWTTRTHPSETRTFSDWDSAAAFYDGVIEEAPTEKASLVEVTEKEIRCHEQEPSRKQRSETAPP